MSKKGQKVHYKKVFISYRQNQLTLPLNIDSLIPENHVVRVVNRATDQMNRLRSKVSLVISKVTLACGDFF